MKDQYFGDINDFRKYGLLRALQKHGSLDLLVGWMLTGDDGGGDGALREYLREPEKWRSFDAELHDGLRRLLRRRRKPRVSLIESSDLLPRTSYFSMPVPDGCEEREVWRSHLLEAASGKDLVFLDPDNGIEIPSRPIGRKSSSKYAAWSDIQSVWDLGCSVLVYQHFARRPREAFAQSLVDELHRHTNAPAVHALRTANVLFLLVTQPRHEAAVAEFLSTSLPAWYGQIDPLELKVSVPHPIPPPDPETTGLFCPFDGHELTLEEKLLEHWVELLRCPHCENEYFNQLDMRNIYPPARLPTGTIRAARCASPEKLEKILPFGGISDAYNVLPYAFWIMLHDLSDAGDRIMGWFGNVEVARRFFVSRNPKLFPKSYLNRPYTRDVRERFEELRAHLEKLDAAP
jgi:hypothetical protein